MTPPSAVWRGWDGRVLRWHAVAATAQSPQVELCLDGVVFERGAGGTAEHEREFAYSPSGNAQIEFSLQADGLRIGVPWRVEHGRGAVPGVQQWQGAQPSLQPLADAPLPPGAVPLPPVAIVVPIYNSPELVQRCIDAVLRWTPQPLQLILIDDASSDAAIAPLLARHAATAGVTLRRNERNMGFTHSCNLGIGLAGSADVVLLNSDTEVGPRWLQRLRLTAHAHAETGTVTAVSDNAGAFSVPELEQYCPIPARWTLAQAQRALLQQARGCLPELPTGNGFCMYIKRAMLERIGLLDAQAFPSGYGEENDLCQRGERSGFRHVIAGDVLVRHARSASFGEERRRTLGAQGMAVLRARYPDYEAKVGATLFSFARRVLDYRVRRTYADGDGIYAAHPPRPRLLLTADSAEAGAQLARRLAQFECFALVGSGTGWKVYTYAGSAMPFDEIAAADEANLSLWLARHAIERLYAPDMDTGVRAAAARALVPLAAALEDPA